MQSHQHSPQLDFPGLGRAKEVGELRGHVWSPGSLEEQPQPRPGQARVAGARGPRELPSEPGQGAC